MIFCPFFDLLHAVGILFAGGLVAISLFIYTQRPFAMVTPLSALQPLIATITGIVLYHCFLMYSIPLIGALCGVYFLATRRHDMPTLHAMACALCAALVLWVDYHRFNEKRELLKHNAHTLHGLIIDQKKWLATENGAVVTVSLSHIDYAPASGIFKFFAYIAPSLAVGDSAVFFKVTASADANKEKLLPYALRDHQIGICFTPYVYARKLPEKTYYGIWIAWWHSWREQLYTYIKSLLPDKVFTYFSALFFGNKDREDFLDIRAKFTRWGLTHYLARSGLHISLLISLWAGVLRFIPIPFPLKAIVLSIILFVYDHLSWASISFNRSLWLWFFYLGGWLSSNAASPIFGLIHLALAILLYNPWQAECLDFQLSFFLTMILMLYGHYKQQPFLLSSCVNKKK